MESVVPDESWIAERRYQRQTNVLFHMFDSESLHIDVRDPAMPFKSVLQCSVISSGGLEN
jgi:hypothetical protein